jgi:hypothetical protein
MPIPLRKFYAQKLIEAKETEKKMIEDSTKQSQDIPRPTFQKS